MTLSISPVRAALPGLLLCAAVSAASLALAAGEAALFGRAWVEALVLAILLGAAVKTFHGVDARFQPGIDIGAKLLLEIAVVLLGASVSAAALLGQGLALVAGIALLVALAIVIGYAICRALALPPKMALLVACGNAICGNSAIAAVAPVIDAEGRDVAAAIAFTAVLGVLVVLALPLLAGPLGLSPAQYGMFAGLTVYAVPQVLAATAPVSAASAHAGTLVKLLRVLMLGPVVLVLSLLGRHEAHQEGRQEAHQEARQKARQKARRPALSELLPWFIGGFLALLALRSLGAIPQALLGPAHETAGFLTLMSMAALGLGVDARAVLRAGPRVAAAVVLSLLALCVLGLGLVALVGPA
ncbi:putative sulfate exporter family transporter [Massilia sp.]|uniref:YeiH family protein n=1 Tax=Massilia sp. TaxID=1882437 RepID=UPI0028AB8781|nr:putative sulfate exporter family transporter [Massilia sp.]